MECKALNLFVALLSSLLVTANPAYAFLAPTGQPLYIVLSPVEVQSDQQSAANAPDSSAAIAKVVQEVLPQYFQRAFEKAFDRRVIFSPGQTLTSGAIPTMTVFPKVLSMGSLGIQISATVVSRSTSPTYPGFQFSESVLMSPDANYGDVDVRLNELGLRLAKRLTEYTVAAVPPERQILPTGIVGFYCVMALDPTDARLSRVARLLTIELPFHLTQASHTRGLDLSIRGLDLKEFLVSCESRSGSSTDNASSDNRIENFSWISTISNTAPPSGARLVVQVSERSKWQNYRPLQPINIDDMYKINLTEIADKIIANFLADYQSSRP
jgi:hypothetical protein